MRLWSWQGEDYDISSGRLDLRFSQFNSTVPQYDDKISILSDLLRCDNGQFIWCFSTKTEATHSSWSNRTLWELEVPENGILDYYDDIAWHKLIKRGGCSYWRIKGHRISDYMHTLAKEKGLNDLTETIKFFEQLEAVWWDHKCLTSGERFFKERKRLSGSSGGDEFAN